MVRDRQLLIRLEERVRDELKARVEGYDPKANVGTVLYEIVARIADGSLPLSVALGEDSAIPEQSVIDSILARLDAIESRLEDSEPIAVSESDSEPVNYFPEVGESSSEKKPETPADGGVNQEGARGSLADLRLLLGLGDGEKAECKAGPKPKPRPPRPDPPTPVGWGHRAIADVTGRTYSMVSNWGTEGRTLLIKGVEFRLCSHGTTGLWHPFTP